MISGKRSILLSGRILESQQPALRIADHEAIVLVAEPIPRGSYRTSENWHIDLYGTQLGEPYQGSGSWDLRLDFLLIG